MLYKSLAWELIFLFFFINLSHSYSAKKETNNLLFESLFIPVTLFIWMCWILQIGICVLWVDSLFGELCRRLYNLWSIWKKYALHGLSAFFLLDFNFPFCFLYIYILIKIYFLSFHFYRILYFLSGRNRYAFGLNYIYIYINIYIYIYIHEKLSNKKTFQV